jgi:cell division protein FtsW
MNSLHGSKRLVDYFATLSDAGAVSYHVRQALVALGSGGLLGRGLGASYQKFGYLPAPHTDSVFAVLGEELGLLGCLVVVALFALLAQRGFKIALEAREPFGAVLAAGLTCWLMLQAFINVAVMTATIPFTGIPLPFLSVGGSAMVSSLGAVGLLLSVSRGSRGAITSKVSGRSGTASGEKRSSEFSHRPRKGGSKRAGSIVRWRNRRARVSRIGRR